MVTQVKEEYFELNRSVSGMTETDIAVSTGEGLQNAWEYQVPVGYSLVFGSKDRFAAYLALVAGPGTECAVGSTIDVVLADSSKQSVRSLLNTIRYSQARGSATTFLAFQDEQYFNYLDVPEGEVFTAEEGEWVIIRANVNAAMDASLCFWILTCKRIRHTLFE